MSSCSGKVDYQKKDIKIRPRVYSNNSDSSLYINQSYITNDDCYMYETKSLDKPFDRLDKGSVVTIMDDEDDNFILINFNNNIGYVKREVLKEI